MKEELEQQLIDKFPKLLSGRTIGAHQNLMCFGCQCCDGWFNMLVNMCEELSKHEDVVLMQVKEKYGSLRIHLAEGHTDEVNEIIRRYEKASTYTCEVCGSTLGTKIQGDNGWYQALCITCNEDKINNRGRWKV